MEFDDFVQNISQLKNKPLGGLMAQFKLAPQFRLEYESKKDQVQHPKKAAVLALFYPNKLGETSFILTQRASYKGVHSAQISFPGGKIERQDHTAYDTALRETFEEIGVSKTSILKIRELTQLYIPPSDFLVTPFLACTHQKPVFRLNDEVASVLEVRVSHLMDDANISSIHMTTPYMKKISVPCFKFQHHIVWGATGMILSEIKELLR